MRSACRPCHRRCCRNRRWCCRPLAAVVIVAELLTVPVEVRSSNFCCLEPLLATVSVMR